MKLKSFKQWIGIKRLLFAILFSFFLLSPILLASSTVKAASYSHPQAVLSLSGTLGENGWYTSDVDASLYAMGDDSDSVTTQYALYNRAWTTFEEPFLIFQEGQTTIYYRIFNENTDYIGETKFSMVDIDKTPPTGAVTIDAGNKDTYSLTVTLTVSVKDEPSGPTTNPPSGYIWGVPSGPSDMRFSNDGHVWSSWEPIAKEKTWLLESGGGAKTVYVQAKDNAGLVSEAFSDTINLIITQDNTPPTTKIIVSGRQNSQGTYTSAVAVTLNSVDDLSGISLTEYSFDNRVWTKYANPVQIGTEGLTIIYYRSHDINGNVESSLSNSVKIEMSENNESISSLVVFAIICSALAGVLLVIFMVRRNRGNVGNNAKIQPV